MTTAGLDTQPSAVTYDLDDLVDQAWRGNIRVPHFQRDFRWATRDVTALFDSIAHGYPIGSLLLWVRRSPAARITLGSLEIDAPGSDGALWVVDGQQRVTSLANALHPDGNRVPPFNIVYDLENRDFLPAPGVPRPALIPVPVLFDLDRLIDWYADGARAPQESFAEARRVAKLLRQYKVPATLVRQDDERIMVDIFDRVNNYGKRLGRAEIFSALFAGQEHGGERVSIASVADRVAARTGFGRLADDTILAAILARRGPDSGREIRSEFESQRGASDFPDEDRDAAYDEGEQALVLTVEFLRNDVGVPHVSMLAYRARLVVLTRFFGHFPTPDERSRQLLRRVYWRVAVSGPAVFKGSFTAIGRVLSSKIHPGDEHGSVQRLVEALHDAPPLLPSVTRFKMNEATTKIVLCSWWALRPLSPVTGAPYDAQDLSDLLADQTTASLAVSRIIRRGVSPDESLWPANHLFVPSGSDPVDDFPFMLGAESSSSWAGGRPWGDVLASYCMTPESAGYLAAGRAHEFLRVRQETVAAELARFVRRMAEWDYEDTPPLDSLDLDDPENDDPENDVDGAG
jgi:hypothetical protein